MCKVINVFTSTLFIYFSAKNNVHMVGMDTTASRSANVKMEELVIQLMGAVPAPQVGRVLRLINTYVLTQKYMDLIAH